MKALTASGVDPLRWCSKFRERPQRDSDAAVAVLQRLTDCQVRVAIDDFGSSLAPLKFICCNFLFPW